MAISPTTSLCAFRYQHYEWIQTGNSIWVVVTKWSVWATFLINETPCFYPIQPISTIIHCKAGIAGWFAASPPAIVGRFSGTACTVPWEYSTGRCVDFYLNFNGYGWAFGASVLISKCDAMFQLSQDILRKWSSRMQGNRPYLFRNVFTKHSGVSLVWIQLKKLSNNLQGLGSCVQACGTVRLILVTLCLKCARGADTIWRKLIHSLLVKPTTSSGRLPKIVITHLVTAKFTNHRAWNSEA